MPARLFEVEHSTDIKNSLLKFAELQDFAAHFAIVADIARKREFDEKLGAAPFQAVAKRVEFIDYETVSSYHTKAHELAALNQAVAFL